MELFEKVFNEHCKHETTVDEDSVIFCASCGEEIHRIMSTGKEYSERFVYRSEYDRTKRFTRLLDECGVDTTGVCVEIMNDFKKESHMRCSNSQQLVVRVRD